MANPFAKSGEPRELWANYRTSLLVALRRCEVAAKAQTPPVEVDPAIKALLAGASGKDWEPLYEAEQRLLPYFSFDDVKADFARRTEEAERFGVKSIVRLKGAFDEPAATELSKRSLHACLIEDIHFRYAKLRLDSRERASKVSSLNVVGSFFVLLFLALLVNSVNGHLKIDSRIMLILLVGTFGAIGAFFSRSIELQNGTSGIDYDVVMRNFSFRSLFLRVNIGIIAAVMLFFLILSGLLGGEFFPKAAEIIALQGQDTISLASPSVVIAKLIVWSFIAGFSERLVSGTLSRLDSSGPSKSPSVPG